MVMENTVGNVFIGVIYIALSVIITYNYRKREIGWGWIFIISLIATPIIGWIIALISSKKPEPFTNAWYEAYGNYQREINQSDEGPVYTDEVQDMIDEIEMIQDDPYQVRMWLKNKKSETGWVPDKVYARAMAAIKGREWLPDDEYYEDKDDLDDEDIDDRY